MNSFDPSSVFDKAHQLQIALTAEINHRYKNLLANHPLKQYMAHLDHLPAFGAYPCISSEIEDMCKRIVSEEGLPGLSAYHRLLLVTLIVQAKDKMKLITITSEAAELFLKNFSLIVKFLEVYPPEYYQHTNDKFSKNLAICILQLVPMGAQKIVINGIPKKSILNAGVTSGAEMLFYVISQMGNFKPLYELHTDQNDTSLLSEFTLEGWDRCYLKIAAMMELNLDVKGVFGISWFFDPQLDKISPRLNFLRARPLHNGGRLFFVDTDKEGKSGALARSPMRQRLFESGEYVPRRYMMIWPRKHLLHWATRFKADSHLRGGEG